jgi:hypothetical protein
MKGTTPLAVALLLATSACGNDSSTGAAATGTPVPPSPTPTVAGRATDKQTPTTPAEAAAMIRSKVSEASPVLLPDTVPAGWSATAEATSSTFTVTYVAPNGVDANVRLELALTNPPPPGPHGSQTRPGFRGDARSLYQVDDTTMQAGSRFLIWTEPGRWTGPSPGVPYLLSAVGVTDADFWKIARSLRTG